MSTIVIKSGVSLHKRSQNDSKLVPNRKSASSTFRKCFGLPACNHIRDDRQFRRCLAKPPQAYVLPILQCLCPVPMPVVHGVGHKCRILWQIGLSAQTFWLETVLEEIGQVRSQHLAKLLLFFSASPKKRPSHGLPWFNLSRENLLASLYNLNLSIFGGLTLRVELRCGDLSFEGLAFGRLFLVHCKRLLPNAEPLREVLVERSKFRERCSKVGLSCSRVRLPYLRFVHHAQRFVHHAQRFVNDALKFVHYALRFVDGVEDNHE